MMSTPKYGIFIDPRNKRLALEHLLIHKLAKKSKIIEYQAVGSLKGKPPEGYIINFNLNSIVGIDQNNYPIYGRNHILRISIPPRFPFYSAPTFKILTDIWHPNIHSDGIQKGKICIDPYFDDIIFNLDFMITEIGNLLIYKKYHIDHLHPYPVNLKAAIWVKDFGEPNLLTNKMLKIYTDDDSFFPNHNREKIRSSIKIIRK